MTEGREVAGEESVMAQPVLQHIDDAIEAVINKEVLRRSLTINTPGAHDSSAVDLAVDDIIRWASSRRIMIRERTSGHSSKNSRLQDLHITIDEVINATLNCRSNCRNSTINDSLYHGYDEYQTKLNEYRSRIDSVTDDVIKSANKG